MTINDRALAYLCQTYKGRNIRIDAQGGFEIESGSLWSRIAYIATPSSMTGHQTLLIDVTGDSDRIMLAM